jgi:hypothetical protein
MDMGSMFRKTTGYKLDLRTFNTSGVKSMRTMFRGAKIYEIDISSFNFSEVTTISHAFAEVETGRLILPNLNTLNTATVSRDRAKECDVTGLFYLAKIGACRLKGLSIDLRSEEQHYCLPDRLLKMPHKAELLDIRGLKMHYNSDKFSFAEIMKALGFNSINISNGRIITDDIAIGDYLKSTHMFTYEHIDITCQHCFGKIEQVIEPLEEGEAITQGRAYYRGKAVVYRCKCCGRKFYTLDGIVCDADSCKDALNKDCLHCSVERQAVENKDRVIGIIHH